VKRGGFRPGRELELACKRFAARRVRLIRKRCAIRSGDLSRRAAFRSRAAPVESIVRARTRSRILARTD